LERVAQIMVGYVMACIAAGISLIVGLVVFGSVGWPLAPDELFLGLLFAFGAAVAAFGFGFIPSLMAVLIAELHGVRGLWVHLVFGAMTGIGCYLLYPFRIGAFPLLGDAVAFACAGSIGGLVYRDTAGRFAGRTHADRVSPEDQQT
jgi:hypothetical protein